MIGFLVFTFFCETDTQDWAIKDFKKDYNNCNFEKISEKPLKT